MTFSVVWILIEFHLWCYPIELLIKKWNESKLGCGGYSCSQSITRHKAFLEPLYQHILEKYKDILTGKVKAHKTTTNQMAITVAHKYICNMQVEN